MENEEIDEATIPLRFSTEEIKHVIMAMKSYRKAIENFPESYPRSHALGVVNAIFKELTVVDEDLAVSEAQREVRQSPTESKGVS